MSDRLQKGAESARQTPPLFSLITAVYNVGRYLPEFIESVDQQRSFSSFEVIAVDDGSSDDSLDLLRAWEERRPALVTVLSQANGGQGSARNLGIEHARGEWLSFPDPDDLLDPGYLDEVRKFIEASGEVDMFAAYRVELHDSTERMRDTHPLRQHFAAQNRVVEIEGQPEFFHGSAPCGFYRRKLVELDGLRFDTRVRPNFEDGHFSCRYLLARRSPTIGFVSTAKYRYRKRADGTSTMQRSQLDPRRFTDVPRYGYLDVLEEAVSQRGEPPEWLQNFVLYELSWYFAAEARASESPTAAHGVVAKEFVRLLAEIGRLLSPTVIQSFGIREFRTEWRDFLCHALTDEQWVSPYVVTTRADPASDLVQIAYRFVGEPPDTRILVRGTEFEPEHQKIRSHVLWEQRLLHEYVAWVPGSETLRVLLNGVPMEIRSAWPERTVTSMRPAQGEQMRASSAKKARHLSPRDRAVVLAAGSLPARRIFRDSWVFIDRVNNADDNAERLFEYVRNERPEINAWFVVEKRTPDWERLRARHDRRVIPYGSEQWRLLMLNCRHLISSHADVAIVGPPEILRLGPPPWRFSFLQHGVIRDDISRWLNPKSIDLFVTSSEDEYQSIVGDYSNYVFTSREVKITGMPRFDRLRVLASRTPTEAAKYVLICPTWRNWLSGPKKAGTSLRGLAPEFFDSRFLRCWVELLTDSRLKESVQGAGLKLVFLPHPALEPALPALDLPPHVEVVPYKGVDVQKLLVESAAMITDYSSISFNMAYMDRPVVYYQFDFEEYMNGGHISRVGYFDYHEDGFGPICPNVGEVVDAVTEIVGNGSKPLSKYLDRMHEALPLRDGRCCERTVAAIESMDAEEASARERQASAQEGQRSSRELRMRAIARRLVPERAVPPLKRIFG